MAGRSSKVKATVCCCAEQNKEQNSKMNTAAKKRKVMSMVIIKADRSQGIISDVRVLGRACLIGELPVGVIPNCRGAIVCGKP